MPVTNVTSDAAARTMTLTSDLAAPPQRAWQLFADPRQLEQWWTPPEMPLTITDHDLSVGGYLRAFVTTAEGEKVRSYWRISAVEPGLSMEWEDGFLDEQGEISDVFPPATMKLTLTERAGGGTVMTIVIGWASDEAMALYLEMDIAAETTNAVARAEALLAY